MSECISEAAMPTTEPLLLEPDPTIPDHDPGPRRANAVRRVSHAVTTVRSSATTLVGRMPGTVRATRARASEATSALQRLPDSTLRWLAAGSLGVAAGFQLAGAPRLVRAAGAAPALLMGAAIALRPTDEHAKGAISNVEGTIEEGIGKLTGDKGTELHGKARQVQGSAQQGLGDVQDTLKGYRGEDKDGA
jgi:uncharacterized protein YjbJ (UPF0337 family)